MGKLEGKVAMITAAEVLIVGGVAHGLDLASRLFIDAGDSVLLENPHYLGARRTFEAAGAESISAEVDEEGGNIASDSAERRDACRVAYLVLPSSLVELFRAAKWACDWSSPTFEQVALSRHLGGGDFERHLRRARTLDAESRKVLVEAIGRELAPFKPSYRDSQAGLHLLVRFGALPAKQVAALIHQGEAEGVRLYPSAPCYWESGPDALELVLGFGRLEAAEIHAGIGGLRRILESGLSGSSELESVRGAATS